MDMFISILVSLGVDFTVFFQLGFFLATFTVLYFIVFKPYGIASEEREKLTTGSFQFAEQAEESIRKTQEKYQTRARQINDEISLVFKEQRALGVKEAEHINEDASLKAKDIMNQAQLQLSNQLESAQSQLDLISKDISGVIIEQLLSKRGKN